MFVILNYDVKQKSQQNQEDLKKYLFHAQKSVIEGYLTEAQLNMLESDLVPAVDPDEDFLCVYKVPYYPNVVKDKIGYSMSNDIAFINLVNLCCKSRNQCMESAKVIFVRFETKQS